MFSFYEYTCAMALTLAAVLGQWFVFPRLSVVVKHKKIVFFISMRSLYKGYCGVIFRLKDYTQCSLQDFRELLTHSKNLSPWPVHWPSPPPPDCHQPPSMAFHQPPSLPAMKRKHRTLRAWYSSHRCNIVGFEHFYFKTFKFFGAIFLWHLYVLVRVHDAYTRNNTKIILKSRSIYWNQWKKLIARNTVVNNAPSSLHCSH